MNIKNLLFFLLAVKFSSAQIILELPKNTDPLNTYLSASWLENNKKIDLTGKEETKDVQVQKRLEYSKRAGQYKIIFDKEPINKGTITFAFAQLDPQIKFHKIKFHVKPGSRYSFSTTHKICENNKKHLIKDDSKKYTLCVESIY